MWLYYFVIYVTMLTMVKSIQLHFWLKEHRQWSKSSSTSTANLTKAVKREQFAKWEQIMAVSKNLLRRVETALEAYFYTCTFGMRCPRPKSDIDKPKKANKYESDIFFFSFDFLSFFVIYYKWEDSCFCCAVHLHQYVWPSLQLFNKFDTFSHFG